MIWFALLACAPDEGVVFPPEGFLSTDPTPVQPPPAPAPDPLRGFSWVVDDVLAAMPHPRDLDAVSAQGVGTLVSLTVEPLDPEALASAGLASVHLPVEDFTAPTLEQMYTFVQTVEQGQVDGVPVGVHCTAGLGRSGTMAAAWFIYQGESVEAALYHIRQVRPGSVETLSQEEALVAFEAGLQHD